MRSVIVIFAFFSIALFSCKPKSSNFEIRIRAIKAEGQNRELFDKNFRESVKVLNKRLNALGHFIEKTDYNSHTLLVKAYDVRGLNLVKATLFIKGDFRANVLYKKMGVFYKKKEALKIMKSSPFGLDFIFASNSPSDKQGENCILVHKKNILSDLKIKSAFLTYHRLGDTYYPVVNIFFHKKHLKELERITKGLKGKGVAFSIDRKLYAVLGIGRASKGGVLNILFKDMMAAEVFARTIESGALKVSFKIEKIDVLE